MPEKSSNSLIINFNFQGPERSVSVRSTSNDIGILLLLSI
jgi:hypothetical protein